MINSNIMLMVNTSNGKDTESVKECVVNLSRAFVSLSKSCHVNNESPFQFFMKHGVDAYWTSSTRYTELQRIRTIAFVDAFVRSFDVIKQAEIKPLQDKIMVVWIQICIDPLIRTKSSKCVVEVFESLQQIIYSSNFLPTDFPPYVPSFGRGTF